MLPLQESQNENSDGYFAPRIHPPHHNHHTQVVDIPFTRNEFATMTPTTTTSAASKVATATPDTPIVTPISNSRRKVLH
jgi:hypothetical protein